MRNIMIGMEKISRENREATAALKAEQERLKEKLLKQREMKNEEGAFKVQHEMEMIERAIMEQKEADERMSRLVKKQKREKQELHKKIIELEKLLDAKQALELDIILLRQYLDSFSGWEHH